MNWETLVWGSKRIITGMAVLALCLAMFSPLALAKDKSTADTKVYQVIDSENTDKLPRNFRTTNDSIKPNDDLMPSIEGMAKLNASGSGAFSEKNLQKIKEKLGNKKVIVVDLREESHLFVNGVSVSWYAQYNWGNVGKSRDDIKEDEKEKKEKIIKEDKTIFYKIIKKGPNGTIAEAEPVELITENVKTEKELVKSAGLDYFRITVTDHRRPQDEDVDRFVEFARELDDKTWLHFHCRAGEGRTTSFMVMYDMMHNAEKVSCEDIVKRQFLLDDEDLFDTVDEDPVKVKCKTERALFIRKFYEYCQYAHKDDFKISWSQWIAKHK